MLCLRGRRMGPVLRLDLPRGLAANRATAQYLVQQSGRHATKVALICYTDERNGAGRGRPSYPREDLIGMCVAELRAVGMPVFDAMLIRDGLVWSYLRHSPADEGYPLPAAGDQRIGHLSSANVAAGRAVLPDREALAATVQGPTGIRAEAAMRQFTLAADRFASRIADLNHRQTIAEGCRIAEDRLTICSAANLAGRAMPIEAVADLALLVSHTQVRDVVVSWALQRVTSGSLSLCLELARWSPDEVAAPVCEVLGLVAYRHGDGALAQLAVDRVVACEPENRLAGTLVELFNSGTEPAELDSLILEWSNHPANPDAPCWHCAERDSTAIVGDDAQDE